LINISSVYYVVLSDNIIQNELHLPDFLTVVVVFVYQRQEDGKLLDTKDNYFDFKGWRLVIKRVN